MVDVDKYAAYEFYPKHHSVESISLYERVRKQLSPPFRKLFDHVNGRKEDTLYTHLHTIDGKIKPLKEVDFFALCTLPYNRDTKKYGYKKTSFTRHYQR